jgi:hypothetical protein
MDSKIIILKPGKDFTTIGLASFLNKKFGGKKTGKKFTIGDLQQYAMRGRLPEDYGGHPIEVSENGQIGIKILKVDFTRSVFDDKKKKDN